MAVGGRAGSGIGGQFGLSHITPREQGRQALGASEDACSALQFPELCDSRPPQPSALGGLQPAPHTRSGVQSGTRM